MLFGVVSGVRLGMGVLDFSGDRPRGRGSFGGEFAASHCNQWGLCCVVGWKCVKRGEWCKPRHSCVRWKSTCLKGKGPFLAWFLAFFGICAVLLSMGENDVLIADKCIRLVCEKLTVLPYGHYVVEFCVR